MNTLKMVKKAKLHIIIFTCACIVSNIGFYLNDIKPKDIFFGIGLYSMVLWALNPFPLWYSLKGLLYYRIDRKCEENRTIIGRKWFVLLSTLICSTTLYYISAGIMVALTGGV